MFGQTWSFETTRKYVTLVGKLHDNILISRVDANTGSQTQLIKVPLMYAPKDKMLARVTQDPGIDRTSATVACPIISFEMTGLRYNGDRKLKTTGRSAVVNSANNNFFNYQYNPVPYDVAFKLHVFVKNVDDGLQIIEQILPFYTPDWTTSVNLIPEMGITIDVPVVLNGVEGPVDTYTGALADNRTITWTLDMTLKGYYWGPVKKSGIIKFANVNFRIATVPDGQLVDAVGNTAVSERVTVQPGLDANGHPTSNIAITIPYRQIWANDDYGFVTQIINLASDEDTNR